MPKDLYIAFYTLQKYKYLLKHTLASCLLNKQVMTLRLICINKVPSVSHCSTVMLYVTVC